MRGSAQRMWNIFEYDAEYTKQETALALAEKKLARANEKLKVAGDLIIEAEMYHQGNKSELGGLLRIYISKTADKQLEAILKPAMFLPSCIHQESGIQMTKCNDPKNFRHKFACSKHCTTPTKEVAK